MPSWRIEVETGFSRRHFLAGGLASLALTAVRPGWSQSLWESFPKPEGATGLIINPRLVSLKDRITLFWAGTNKDALSPEVMYCSAGDGDNAWNKSRAPFFGNDMGRVRRLAAATSRDAMAVIFQRETTQGNGAVEILLSVSYDSGYSFGTPFVLDSYVLGKEGGSYVSCAARQGKQRPEFAALWVAEGGVVRACNIDPRSGFRPRAVVVGEVETIRSKAEVVGAGPDGFYALWPQTKALKQARIHPLTGTIDPAATLTTGDIQRNFCGASYYRGPGIIASASEPGDFKLFAAQDEKLSPAGASKFPVNGRKLDSRACLEQEKHLHLAIVEGGSTPKLYYTTNRSGSWSQPEVVATLQADVDITGFDIALSGESVWMVVAQEQLCGFYRRKLS